MKTQNIKSFSEQVFQVMNEQLELIALENRDAIAKASKSLLIIKSSLIELKRFVHQYNFKDSKEEIEFFKEIKPKFTSLYYYNEKLLSLKIDEPIGNRGELIEYYYSELQCIQDFIKTNQEFHRYWLTNSTHLDDQYFRRESHSTANPNMDDKFSTPCDNTLALLLANQMLKEYLLIAIKNEDTETGGTLQSTLTWTGSKTSLIELIYALQSVEAFNNGKSDIKQIATSLEHIFHVSLGNYYRVFQEIRLRKSGTTNFLDQLKDKFVQRIDELDQH